MDDASKEDNKSFLVRMLYCIFLPIVSIPVAILIAYMATRNDTNFEGARDYGFVVLSIFWWLAFTTTGALGYLLFQRHVRLSQIFAIALVALAVGWIFS